MTINIPMPGDRIRRLREENEELRTQNALILSDAERAVEHAERSQRLLDILINILLIAWVAWVLVMCWKAFSKHFSVKVTPV